VWTVTVRDGKLKVVGRLVADRCPVSRARAARFLGRTVDDLWESDCWVLAKPESGERVREIDVTSVGGEAAIR
jgi:hypothetical protein